MREILIVGGGAVFHTARGREKQPPGAKPTPMSLPPPFLPEVLDGTTTAVAVRPEDGSRTSPSVGHNGPVSPWNAGGESRRADTAAEERALMTVEAWLSV
ncbi:hypothetical protein GCM10023205_67250 [Yinghuangia aomiensis]|uniref:Uncharacterized protein n=1 Tax=Yinghuangia aomiensis TaxID=676205 RepID=A0ABP9I4R0_9ACTN